MVTSSPPNIPKKTLKIPTCPSPIGDWPSNLIRHLCLPPAAPVHVHLEDGNCKYFRNVGWLILNIRRGSHTKAEVSHYIHKDTEGKLHSGKVCYHSIFSSSCLKPKNVKIIHKNIYVPVALYGCQIWSFIIWGHSLRVAENSVMMRIT